MKKEFCREKFNYYITVKNNLWTAFLVLTGGLAGLALNLDSLIKYLFLVTGFIIEYFLIKIINSNNSQLQVLLKKIDEENIK
jgi:hypothetical protein